MNFPRDGKATSLVLGLVAVIAVAAAFVLLRDKPARPARPAVVNYPGIPIDISRLKLPWAPDHAYRVEAYLEVAAQLQAMPRDQAIAQLRAWATDSMVSRKIVFLCRMLFEPRPGQKPGGLNWSFIFVGKMPNESGRPMHRNLLFALVDDWPYAPIGFVNDIPFCIVERIGPSSGPLPTRGEDFLRECLRDMQWTSRHYAPATPAELTTALDELLNSSLWKRPLTAEEIKFLSDQIRPPSPAGAPPIVSGP